jgi:hypothetical protein
LDERLALLQTALPAGRWQDAAAGAATLHAQAQAAGRPDLAAEAGLLAAKALFNLDQLDRAEAWCSLALVDARDVPHLGLQPALWVVAAAVRARLEQVSGAIDAVNRALSLLDDGLPAGVALQQVASVLGAGLRGLDRVGRWGGEEFAVLLPHTGLVAACAVTERLRCAVESQDWLSMAPGLAVSISAGVVATGPDESSEQAVARADKLLYRAKREGRNRVVGERADGGT